MNNNRFFTVETEARQQFYQVPKVFMCQDSKYFKLNPMAKLIYAILADRNSVSIKNGWVDEFNRIYFIFNQVELCEILGGIDPKTLRKYLKELENVELLYRKRIGLKQPNRLYLLQVESSQTLINSLMGKNSPSRKGKIPLQEGEKFPPSYNNKSYTNVFNACARIEKNHTSKSGVCNNRFNNFPQREYSEQDLKELEKRKLHQ